jgi:NAD(P)H-dependent flavin oxidoreductase YrpB (nitropropane dioxygenase family)
MTKPVLHTSLCDLLGIEYPILLAGMGSRGKATPPRLVAAVSEAGGMGVLGGSGLPPEVIRRCIREVRSLTTKPFGVDLLLPASLAQAEQTRSAVRRQLQREYPQHVEFVRGLMREYGLPDVYVDDEAVVSPEFIKAQVQVVLEERVPVFAAGLGDPSWVVPLAREQDMKVIGLAGTVRNAMRQLEAKVDIIVAQGHEAGGHTGKIANFPLIPQVVDAVSPTPVVAAGGIADGRGIAAALALGAVGVWVGTAFLVSEECDIPDASKEQILRGRSQDFVVSRTYTGKTARNFRNPVIDSWEHSGLDPLPMPFQKVLMDDFNEAARQAGRFDLHSNPAGQIGGMLRERKPAAQIMAELVEGTVKVLQGLPQTVTAALA